MNWRLLQKFLSEECSPEEKQQVEDWLNADPENRTFMHSLIKIWDVEPKDEIQVDAESAWDSFQHKISEDKVSDPKTTVQHLQKWYSDSRNRRKSSRTVAAIWSVAAVILVTVLVYNIMPRFVTAPDDSVAEQQTTVQQISTERGQRTSVRLMDGTKVQLNAESKIEIPPAFGDSVRRVTLEGEAYFEVAHNPNKPFIVHTADAYTRVLGTKFGVKAYAEDDEIQVVVQEGKVALGSLSRSDLQSKPITKNKRGSITSNGITRVREVANISKYLGWKDGRLIFESSPLPRVISQLERWYDINIVVADQSLRTSTITASFKDEPMTEVLNIITLSIDAHYERSGRTIHIYSNQ